jgi:hypothetical protein
MELQIKTRMGYPLSSIRVAVTTKVNITNLGRSVKKRKACCPGSGDVTYNSHCRK